MISNQLVFINDEKKPTFLLLPEPGVLPALLILPLPPRTFTRLPNGKCAHNLVEVTTDQSSVSRNSSPPVQPRCHLAEAVTKKTSWDAFRDATDANVKDLSLSEDVYRNVHLLDAVILEAAKSTVSRGQLHG